MTPLPLLLALSTAPWANAPLPTPPDLSGRAVLLEFSDDWDPAGQRLLLHAQRAKAAFGDSLALLSVRSPAAGDPHGLASLERQALRREIMHPMVEDDKASLAAASGISGTGLALLGPDGAVLRRFDPGSPYEALERAVAAVVGSLPQRSRPPLAMALERDDFIDRPLAFPTQLAYDAKSDRLLICDTGHNRVVLASGSGRVKVVIGNGAVDYRDGAMARAGFDHPRGVAFAAGDRLLIADTGNDAIRTVDLKAERVTTLIDDPYRLPGPRALLFDGSTLYVAEPLSHSLAAADSKSWTPYRFAGDGREGSRDGLVALARFMAPAAAVRLGRTLYLADPQARSLRALNLRDGSVTTPSLSGPGTPLRRPMALAVLGRRLLIADAADGSLKLLDPRSGRVRILAKGLLRPSGLAVVDRAILVAESDASRISRISADGRTLGPLVLKGLKPLPPGPPMPYLPARSNQTVGPFAVRADAPIALSLSVKLPAGYRLNGRAPLQYRVSETEGLIQFSPKTRKGFLIPPPAKPRDLIFVARTGRQEAQLDVDFYYCRDDGKGLCRGASRRYRVLVDARPGAQARRILLAATP